MSNDILYLDEVAARLRVPVSSVRNWVASGRLRSLKPGRRRLVRARDLDAMLAASVHPLADAVVRDSSEADPTKRESPEGATSRLSEVDHPKTGAEDHEESRPPDHPGPAAIRR